MMKVTKRLLALLVIGYLLGCLYLYIEQRSFIYHGGNPAPEAVSAGYEKLDYQAPDGQKLWGFYRPAPEANAPVLLVFHGNSGIEPIIDDRAAPFATLNAGVFLATYRGFEGNDGLPNEEGLAIDARAAYDLLISRGIAPGQIVLYGHSLGTGVASRLAYQLAKEGTPVGALILEAPFTRMVDMAKNQYWYMPVGLLLKDRFDTADYIGGVEAPVLIMHGGADRTVPAAMGQQLCDLVQGPKRCAYVPEAGHNNMYDYGAIRFVDSFLAGAANDNQMPTPPKGQYDKPLSLIDGDRQQNLMVEIADTPASQQIGMMYRTEIQDDQGMLFLFDRIEPRAFWMKNTLIPLDILFIGPDDKIVKIAAAAQPGDETLIESDVPVKAVLEVKGGQAAQWGMGVGATIATPLLNR